MAIAEVQYTPEEVAERGKALYEQNIQAQVKEGNLGKYLVIDVVTGDYEMGENHLDTAKRARAKRPDAPLYGMRIGYKAVASFGASLRPDEENQTQ